MGGACLQVMAPLTASITLAIVAVAISTNQWLLTEEKMPNPSYNGSGENEYLSKITVSGLWTLCFTHPGEREMHCDNIEYFPKEEYSPDPNDSTMAIPYAVTRSALFFIVATLLLFCGEFSCMYGHFRRSRRIFTFVAGVVFIISGLLMLIGLVMYISVFKAEVGGKLRPRSQLQPPQFTFQYGYSFLLYVSGFMSIETAGTCAVFLYIYRHQRDWSRKHMEMTTLNHRKLSSSSALLPDQNVYASGTLYPCRRHPQYTQPLMGNHIVSPCPRRLYLEQAELESPPLTPRQVASSCVGVCIGPHDQRVSNVTSTYYSYPDAYHPSELDVEMPHRWELPRDITTHTVSTTADINCDDFPTDFEVEEMPPLRSPSLRHDNFDPLRRTTPV
ncbi:voltage-dependent calcium channel gamma-5 subunit [Halyomorpha halys]|uniref:voltage-dependent calcium channel gamma-5 subunit n=1 Tax=Halyomorpha halys TaxID=286706 RepID=UPI0006D4FFD0